MHIDTAFVMLQDLGRPEYESLIGDVAGTLKEAQVAVANVEYWMRPEFVSTDLLNQPGTSRIERTPKGVGEFRRFAPQHVYVARLWVATGTV